MGRAGGVVGVITFFAWPQGTLKTAFGVGGALWILAGTARFVWSRLQSKGSRFTAEMVGMVLAHAGIAVFVAGVFLTESTSIEKDVAARPGQSFELRGHDFLFQGVENTRARISWRTAAPWWSGATAGNWRCCTRKNAPTPAAAR